MPIPEWLVLTREASLKYLYLIVHHYGSFIVTPNGINVHPRMNLTEFEIRHIVSNLCHSDIQGYKYNILDDIPGESKLTCYICFDNVIEINNPIINPCRNPHCEGCHKACFDFYLQKRQIENGGVNCPMCRESISMIHQHFGDNMPIIYASV